MKRVIVILLALLLTVSFSACGSDVVTSNSSPVPAETVAPTEAQSVETTHPETTAETVAVTLKTFPLNIDRNYANLAQELPDHIYSTSGAENGLGGTVYQFTGTVEECFTTEAVDVTVEHIVVSTEGGPVLVSNYYKGIYNFSMLQVGPDLTKAYYPYSVDNYVFPNVGETANFVAVYVGYSGAEELPAFILGANSTIFELFEFDDPAEIDEQIPESTEALGSAQNPYSEGMYKVGVDLPAGEYLFIANSSTTAYVCVSSDSNQDKIIENENFEHSFFVTVSDGQYLQAKRCDFVTAANYTVNINDDGTFEDGMYRVGIDIPAGEYRLTPDGSGYYCIYKNSKAPFDILSNDNFDGNTYVTVTDGQYLLIKRCSANPS